MRFRNDFVCVRWKSNLSAIPLLKGNLVVPDKRLREIRSCDLSRFRESKHCCPEISLVPYHQSLYPHEAGFKWTFDRLLSQLFQ